MACNSERLTSSKLESRGKPTETSCSETSKIRSQGVHFQAVSMCKIAPFAHLRGEQGGI